MAARFPLHVKILGWFFLNLALLAAVFILLFNAQFRFDLNWVFATSAGHRVDAMRDLIVSELNLTPPADWDRVIERFSAAYQVRFALFDDEGSHLIGGIDKLPLEIQARIDAPPPPDDAPHDRRPRWRGPPPRTLMRTTDPTHYWLLVGARIDNPQVGGRMHVTLVAEASSLAVGGLIVDPTPWIRLGIGTVVFSVLFWLPLLRGITRSIGKMTNATQEIAEGRFDARVSLRRRDELGSLADAINQMATRLDGLVKNQKRFLGDVAHELCSPLARLQMALGIIEQRADESQKKYTKSAIEKAEQIASLVNELLVFSKASFGASAVHLQPVEVKGAVEQAVRQESSEGADIRTEIPGDICVLADPDLLVRALGNLLRNAIRYGAQSGPITVSAARDGERATIRVADFGPGVPDEELLKIFDAFYRIDASRTRETGGVGLGLTIVKTCIDSCGGSVTAHNRPPHGLEVVVSLPAVEASE